jgi:hypothetical protein
MDINEHEKINYIRQQEESDRYRAEFETILLESPEITNLVKREYGAKMLYSALTNTTWYKKLDVTEDNLMDALRGNIYTWSGSFRYASGLIATIRNKHHGKNESYMDWYCSTTEGIVNRRVAEIMASYGWTPSVS